MNQLLLHVPHASARVPAGLRGSFVCDLRTELRLMTDWYTDELFDFPAPRLVFPVSRLVCDPERFREDENEPMSRVGMGACYTRTHDGQPLRQLATAEREAILRRWYDPHHRRLTELTRRALQRPGACLIVDCHSFPARPLPYEAEQDPRRPDICIGRDGFHTPPRLARALALFFRERGWRVAFDTPFAGALTPLPYYRKEPRVKAVMIEVNRGLYLDENCAKKPSFSRVKADIAAALRFLRERTDLLDI